MICNFCGKEVERFAGSTAHISAAKARADGHVHVHGSLEDKAGMQELFHAIGEQLGYKNIITKTADVDAHVYGEIADKAGFQKMLEAAAAELGIPLFKEANTFSETEIVFHNKQRLGDMLMFTCLVRDFKAKYPNVRVGVESKAMHIWDHNPYLDRDLLPVMRPEGPMKLDKILPSDYPAKTNVLKVGPGWLTNASNRLDWHFANAYRVSAEHALNVQIPQGMSRPDLWFSEEEYNAPRAIPGPYWILIGGGEPGWGCKMYPWEKWQEVVDQNPDITFLQLGNSSDQHPRLKGANVLDWIGKTEDKNTGIRDLFKLFLHAEGSIGLVSFHMHLSGALFKPAVVVAGGREPVSFTRYEGHRYLSNEGTMPCSTNKACWACAIVGENGAPGRCTNLVDTPERVQKKTPLCAEIIDPADITTAIRSYYKGGRLKLGVPSEKPSRKFINVAKEPSTFKVAPKAAPVSAHSRFPLPWGGGSVTDKDWDFIKGVIAEHKINTVLEFGAGLSTLLFNELLGVGNVITFETNEGWVKRIQSFMPGCDVRMWDAKQLDLGEKRFDMAFVDGPAGGQNRELSTQIGAAHGRIVIIHDAGRPFEKQWQERYIQGRFEGPGKGGHRCHLWTPLNGAKHPGNGGPSSQVDPGGDLAEGTTQNAPVSATGQPGGKLVRIVSTARGWGGQARSVTTIMRLLLKAGHQVEFVPFRNQVASREFRQILNGELKDVRVLESYEPIRDPCHALLVYADDFVWELGQPEIAAAFEGVKADRKVMMINYRRGKIGQLEWTKGWDLYAFLNSGQQKELLQVLPGVETAVLPPCTDLQPFFQFTPNYGGGLRIMRHNSQGDTKFISGQNDDAGRERIKAEFQQIFSLRPDAEIHMLPGPEFMQSEGRYRKYSRTGDANVIADFLALGNVFWYSLPPGYMDMGPRVILEAMAAGLPVVADNWGGAPDRVTPETGWICDSKKQQVEILIGATEDELRRKGEAARQRAREHFVPERWVELLTGQPMVVHA